jgi:DNA-binding MarR family transcriptional regulator
MDQVEDCISFVIGKAAQQVARRARELLAPHGVTPVQYAVLKALSEADGASGAELGARLVLDSASVTGVVDRLEALGLLERHAHPQDRRVHRLRLTEKGVALREPLDVAMDRLNAEATRAAGDHAETLLPTLRALGHREGWGEDVRHQDRDRRA